MSVDAYLTLLIRQCYLDRQQRIGEPKGAGTKRLNATRWCRGLGSVVGGTGRKVSKLGRAGGKLAESDGHIS
jgi:hypothetical protein